MNFIRHSDLEGKHAFLSASQWRWLNDDKEDLIRRLCSYYAKDIGTILHEIAAKHIKYRIKVNRYDKKNIMLELLAHGIPGVVIDNIDFDDIFENFMVYVNDGVGFKMHPEVVLFYSENAFGTADAIKYDENEQFLRIHDYKSGSTPAKMEQLLIYAALFCLEYRIKPMSLSGIELRIYQSNEVIYHNPELDEIAPVIDKIVTFDKFLKQVRQEG